MDDKSLDQHLFDRALSQKSLMKPKLEYEQEGGAVFLLPKKAVTTHIICMQLLGTSCKNMNKIYIIRDKVAHACLQVTLINVLILPVQFSEVFRIFQK